MITFDQVSLQYDAKHTALSNINIHIDKGEFVFIVGPSGAGKSTFVKILTHELVPEEGTVIVNGLTINKLKSSKIPYYRRTLGIVFQDFRLLSEKTVYENIAFVLRVTGQRAVRSSRRYSVCWIWSDCAEREKEPLRSSRAANSSAWRLPVLW